MHARTGIVVLVIPLVCECYYHHMMTLVVIQYINALIRIPGIAGAREEDFDRARQNAPDRAKLSGHHKAGRVQDWHHAGAHITISVLLYNLELYLFLGNLTMFHSPGLYDATSTMIH
jgi:hypothetical protein